MILGSRDPTKVQRVVLPARDLVTDTLDSETKPEATRDLWAKGAIVRIRPPQDATDERIEAARRSWLEAGASRVFVEPRPKSTPLPESSLVRQRRASAGVRQIVLDLVEEANSEDGDALRSVIEETMDSEGI